MTKKIGRNDPCPCNSGKKYKQCCQGKAELQAARAHSDEASISKAYQSAVEHHQAGRLPEAEAIYQQILSVEPNHADALHFLGVIAHQVGKNEIAAELISKAIGVNPSSPIYYNNLGLALKGQGKLEQAVVSYRKALALKADFAEAHNNLGIVLSDQGQMDEAIASYRKALALNPRIAEAHSNLGLALKEHGKLDEAIASYRQALALKPDYAGAHNNLGIALLEESKLDEAIASFRKALEYNPRIAEACNNLGIALKDQGQLDEAIASYRNALALKPDYADAHSNLGIALRAQGKVDEAVVSLQRALQLKESPEIRAGFAQCISNVTFSHELPGVRALVIRAMSEPWGRPGDLVPPAISLIKLHPEIGECIDRASGAWPARLQKQELFGNAGMASVADDRLLQCLLENASASDVGLERLLTMARLVLLDCAIAETEPAEADAAVCDLLQENGLRFFYSLATQCFINEYVFAHTEEEFSKARLLWERLGAALAAEAHVPVSWLVAVAAYFPLNSLPCVEGLLHRSWPDAVAALLAQQVQEPEQERRYRAEIPCLTPIEGDVSRLVKQQYEENPYPRWVKATPVGRVVTIDEYLRQTFPFSSFKPLGKVGEIDVLIAGCGTGQQSINTARQFRGAQVLAVDLSLTSLGYAKRKTQALGLENIQYAQADILQLGSLDRMFDLIESVGVLHHLADPMAGWRVLHSLLRPGGFMRLGFYSEYARRDVVAARSFIAERGYASTAEDIRRFRQDLMSGETGAQFKQVLSSRDFYGMSECRDLLFHVQEHRYTLPQLKENLQELCLDFIGFSLDPTVARRYGERFPDDRQMRNLDCWNVFETENPTTFAGMYQFWVQKRA